MTEQHERCFMRALISGLANLLATVAIVLANKIVMYTYGFGYPVALTFFHTLVTWVGMWILLLCGTYESKAVPWRMSSKLAAAHSGCIVLNNVSLHLNTVGFYQISKILQTPAVVLIEVCFYGKLVSRKAATAVGVLLLGVAMASVSDPQVTSNPLGMGVALVAVLTAALNSVWTGSMQREAAVSGNQLLYAMSPYACAILAPAVPLLEPVGLLTASTHSITGYVYNMMTMPAAAWILLSSVLGLIVSQSACLFIGATSGTTYSVMSHTKTLLIVVMGVHVFGDALTLRKIVGLGLALVGLALYSLESLNLAPQPVLISKQKHSKGCLSLVVVCKAEQPAELSDTGCSDQQFKGHQASISATQP